MPLDINSWPDISPGIPSVGSAGSQPNVGVSIPPMQPGGNPMEDTQRRQQEQMMEEMVQREKAEGALASLTGIKHVRNIAETTPDWSFGRWAGKPFFDPLRTVIGQGAKMLGAEGAANEMESEESQGARLDMALGQLHGNVARMIFGRTRIPVGRSAATGEGGEMAPVGAMGMVDESMPSRDLPNKAVFKQSLSDLGAQAWAAVKLGVDQKVISPTYALTVLQPFGYTTKQIMDGLKNGKDPEDLGGAGVNSEEQRAKDPPLPRRGSPGRRLQQSDQDDVEPAPAHAIGNQQLTPQPMSSGQEGGRPVYVPKPPGNLPPERAGNWDKYVRHLIANPKGTQNLSQHFDEYFGLPPGYGAEILRRQQGQ